MLENASIIVVDLETYDPNLTELGSGVYRKDCYVLGAAVLSDTGYKEYLDFGHKGCTAETRARSKATLASILCNNVPKLGHNFLYDLDILMTLEGLDVNGRLEDTQIRESLLDAYAKHYDLDTLSKKYNGPGKRVTEVERICARQGWGGPVQSHLWKMTVDEVRDYALGDVEQTMFIWQQQQLRLMDEGLLDLYDLECRLTRPLQEMKNLGVRTDRQKREQVSAILRKEYSQKMKEFSERYGKININSTADLTRVFKMENIPVVLTDKNNPSFAHDVLIGIDHPVASEILEIRGIKTVLNNYVDGSFVDFDVGGRIHATFYPVVRDDGGTVTGRFSCKNPNLQQIPSKDEKHGPLIREIIIPEVDCDYLKIDYSQIEYRILAHYASGPGALELKNNFINNPKADYHQLVCDLTGLSRKYAKNLNFGTVYCMGIPTMSKKFGWTMEHAKELSDAYFNAMPFVKPTRNMIMEKARQRGYVRTILGRRARLAPEMRSRDGQRGQEYKLVNYLIQGSAADIMKAAMVAAYESGITKVLPTHLTVHDELGCSMPRTKEAREAAKELKHIMETIVPLSVPILADPEVGPNWGQTVEVEL